MSNRCVSLSIRRGVGDFGSWIQDSTESLDARLNFNKIRQQGELYHEKANLSF